MKTDKTPTYPQTLASVGERCIIYRDRFTYNALPSITILDNGEWLVAFTFFRRHEGGEARVTHNDPLSRIYLTRTSDQGRTWEKPCFAPDLDWPGTMDSGVSQLKNGTVVLTHPRLSFYPLSLARKRRAEGKPTFILPRDQAWWTEDFTDEDWDRSQFSWAQGPIGLYSHISIDGGHTFEDTIKIDTSPYRSGSNRVGVRELLDGRIAYAVYSVPLDVVYILFSSTGGKSWDPPILVTDCGFVGETDIAEVAPGELYCIMRTLGRGGYLYGCRSLDGGHTWSVPENTHMYGPNNPGHLLILRDGRLLCTYGRRVAPFGIRACLSEDGGRTWGIDQEIVIRDDLPNIDCGYPATIEYAPGRLFIAHYGQDPEGVTCVQGVYVTLT